jgi:Holliday junction resolvase
MMRRISILTMGAVALGAALLVAGITPAVPTAAAGGLAATTSTPCCNQLAAVSMSSPSSGWAVGDYRSATGTKTLIQHWNGSAWRIVPSPNPGVRTSWAGPSLRHVVALSSGNAWAVGGMYAKIGAFSVERTLVVHWNGITWRVVRSPNVGTEMGGNRLEDISAVSASNMWAVGSHNGRTLIEHWKNGAWHVVKSPNVGVRDNELTGVVAIGPGDVWAVGQYINSGAVRTLTMHWNGRAWRVVRSPNVGGGNNYLLGGVSASSSTNVWAVGGRPGSGRWHTLVLHWNGTRWSVVKSPDAGTDGSVLYGGVEAISPSNVWAVGYRNGDRTLILHWNGAAWRVVRSPNVGTSDNYLSDVNSLSAAKVWSVGSYGDGTTSRTLVERWKDGAWRVVSSPNAD